MAVVAARSLPRRDPYPPRRDLLIALRCHFTWPPRGHEAGQQHLVNRGDPERTNECEDERVGRSSGRLQGDASQPPGA